MCKAALMTAFLIVGVLANCLSGGSISSVSAAAGMSSNVEQHPVSQS